MSIASRNGTFSPASAEFAEKLASLRAQIEELMEYVPEAAEETLENLKSSVADLYEEGEEKAVSATKKAVGTTVETLKKYPLQSALVAVGAGLLTWWLLSSSGGDEGERA